MKIHDKIHDVLTNLGKNPLLTLLLHVSLSRNSPSLSLSKNHKNIKKNEENSPKMREKLFIWLKLSAHA